MKLKYRLLTAFMVASLIPLTGTVFLVNKTMKETLINESIKSLISARNAREESVQSYIDSIREQIETMSSDPSVAMAVQNFSRSFQEMSTTAENEELEKYRSSVSGYYNIQFNAKLKEFGQVSKSVSGLIPKTKAGIALQSLYISDNTHPIGSKNSLLAANDGSTYSEHHKKYHGYFNDFLNKYGFYDVFLVEPDNGHIVYSVYKEIDYATSLKSGPYSHSGIAKAFEAAINANGESVLLDFDRYLPSYNQAASFMARSIIENDTVVGVLIFQMPLDRVNETIANSWGLGETGKAYLIGKDGVVSHNKRRKESHVKLR